ncbi:MAG: type II toxin-antitoxin system VapC family toxin [Prochloron sp. SP5CPC1]|nr:type II toxin-antitoxin system VapC family toxin [Candidatus Paraprochloron terpiosi SP5CPC1]
MNYLLDTNIVTAILKQNQKLKRKLASVQRQGSEIFISDITYFETKRGLLAVNATRKISDFHFFCTEWTILFEDLESIEQAALIYVDLKKRGLPIQDNDILIAATAITKDLILVSHDSDMGRVKNLKLENWLGE